MAWALANILTLLLTVRVVPVLFRVTCAFLFESGLCVSDARCSPFSSFFHRYGWGGFGLFCLSLSTSVSPGLLFLSLSHLHYTLPSIISCAPRAPLISLKYRFLDHYFLSI